MVKTITLKRFLSRLKASIKKAGGQNKWGAVYGFEQSFISNVITGRRVPSERLCKVLGYRPVRASVIRFAKIDDD